MTTAKNTDLARDLSEGISSGRYAVGTLLPTEFELCEQYGLSRYAVRKALDALQELGLISRRKNVGTRVEAMRPLAGFTQSIATVEELARFGAEHVRTVRSTGEVVTDLQLAQALDCPGGTRRLHIACLRMEDGKKARPICWLDLYIDPAYADIGELVRNAPETLASTLIEERYGRRITRIRQSIEAVLIPRERSDDLGVEAGSPALQITRHYLDAADQVFEISVSLHPADRFKFSMDLHRSKE